MRADFSCRTKTAHASRMPVLVSPKAVSDSHNSLTCLDPDASRVSTDTETLVLHGFWFLERFGYGSSLWICVSGDERRTVSGSSPDLGRD